jgi:hypothetical protein
MDAILLQDGLESGHPFCGNPECELHVCVGGPGVKGIGNWAILENGHMTGRGLYGTTFLCDECGRRLLKDLPVAVSVRR